MSFIKRVSDSLGENYLIKFCVESGPFIDFILDSKACHSVSSIDRPTFSLVKSITPLFVKTAIPLTCQAASYLALQSTTKQYWELAAHVSSIILRRLWDMTQNNNGWRSSYPEIAEIGGRLIFAVVDLSQYPLKKHNKILNDKWKIALYMISFLLHFNKELKKIWDLARHVQRVLQTHHELMQANERLEQRLTQTEGRLAIANAQVETLTRTNEQLEQRPIQTSDQLESANAELETLIEDLLKDSEQLQQKLTQTSDQLAIEKAQVETLTEQLKKTLTPAEFERFAQENQQEIDRLTEENRRKAEQINALKKQNEREKKDKDGIGSPRSRVQRILRRKSKGERKDRDNNNNNNSRIDQRDNNNNNNNNTAMQSGDAGKD